jgi:ADP-dependent NAD(P)H-hydrate dehydratase
LRTDHGGARMTALDRDWLADHPLPVHGAGTDKNSRGRVLLAGGARFVPGALRLTGEAALRAGAGKLQMATVADVAVQLGVLVPEAAMIALPAGADGEIGTAAIPVIEAAMTHCDTFILGPGMSETPASTALVAALLGKARDDLSFVLDAAAIGACTDLTGVIRVHGGRVVMTPHYGEMAALTGRPVADIASNDEGVACEVADKYGAVVALKGSSTVIAAPDGMVVHYDGGGVGLATGGSGDVLAGLIGGLLARGASPLAAAAWGVWLHGEAGKLVGETLGPIGFLARDLLLPIPRLMAFSMPKPGIGFR